MEKNKKVGYHVAIETETKNNHNFRKVLYTGEYSQLVLMTLRPGEEIGLEVHEDTDQFFRFESGVGKVIINDAEYAVKDGDAVIVPAMSEHNVINTSDTEALTLYTIYSPSHHRDGVVHATKAEAEADEEEHFDGATSE